VLIGRSIVGQQFLPPPVDFFVRQRREGESTFGRVRTRFGRPRSTQSDIVPITCSTPKAVRRVFLSVCPPRELLDRPPPVTVRAGYRARTDELVGLVVRLPNINVLRARSTFGDAAVRNGSGLVVVDARHSVIRTLPADKIVGRPSFVPVNGRPRKRLSPS